MHIQIYEGYSFSYDVDYLDTKERANLEDREHLVIQIK